MDSFVGRMVRHRFLILSSLKHVVACERALVDHAIMMPCERVFFVFVGTVRQLEAVPQQVQLFTSWSGFPVST
jgi:hypothetical protein